MAIPTATTQMPKGIRLNNPLYLRPTNNPQPHEVTPSQDSEIAQFENVWWGLRAAFGLLEYLVNKKRCKTIAQVISGWVPDNPNLSEYVRWVSNRAVIPPTERLTFAFKNQMCRLLWAIAQKECGREIPFNYFETAYEMWKQKKQ